MAALTGPRNTNKKFVRDLQNYPVAAGAVIHAGGMIAVNATGFLVMASNAAGLQKTKAMGVAFDSVDNTGGANGDVSVRVWTEGVFAFENSGANPVVQATVGDDVNVEDDQTVSILGTLLNTAGQVREIQADGQILVFISG